ncbi:hypothetical protein P7K49_040182 [Saguinus oedipus]|uniref:Uncharacterized protein n=1 Tax=Saguinus oedipus TaxID=9490 RepID=A0ABQ9TA48_SAGOE|nr:hypothetical protein P7K49_040182 [Saguinus oedipus]
MAPTLEVTSEAARTLTLLSWAEGSCVHTGAAQGPQAGNEKLSQAAPEPCAPAPSDEKLSQAAPEPCASAPPDEKLSQAAPEPCAPAPPDEKLRRACPFPWCLLESACVRSTEAEGGREALLRVLVSVESPSRLAFAVLCDLKSQPVAEV